MQLAILGKKVLAWLSPKLLTSIEFRHAFGRNLNWKNPRDLNEKINWLKFYSDTSLWTRCADKYAVRKYVEERGYGDNLVQLYGKWDKVEDIEWESLPKRFVMKVNNGSGDILVCKDKGSLNKDKVLAQFDMLLKKKFSDYNGEPHYKDMKPCVIAEELLDATKQPVKSTSLIDYKIWCFNGEPFCFFVCLNRTPHSLDFATYDLRWERRDDLSVFSDHYRKALVDIPRPKSFDKMIEIARALSMNIPQVRIDLYEVDSKPFFGEMTFSSAGGFMTYFSEDLLKEMGDKCILNNAPKKNV